jgi:hypothetical protein
MGVPEGAAKSHTTSIAACSVALQPLSDQPAAECRSLRGPDARGAIVITIYGFIVHFHTSGLQISFHEEHGSM